MPLRYVALGDSYTIGTAIDADGRWPNQLAARLPALELVANLGVNGYTSRNVIERELPQLDRLRPEVVSLLIGVNDVVQGVPEATYRANVAVILDAMVGHVGAARAFVVTTPDYTVTPSGAAFGDPAQQSAGIQREQRDPHRGRRRARHRRRRHLRRVAPRGDGPVPRRGRRAAPQRQAVRHLG